METLSAKGLDVRIAQANGLDEKLASTNLRSQADGLAD